MSALQAGQTLARLGPSFGQQGLEVVSTRHLSLCNTLTHIMDCVAHVTACLVSDMHMSVGPLLAPRH